MWTNVIRKLKRLKKPSGQSLVEVAIVLPLLLLMLAGMVEVAFGMFAYMTALDLTREAARFASVRDYRELEYLDQNGDLQSGDLHPTTFTADATAACFDGDILHYYYDTACFFTDGQLNPFLEFNAAKYDDVVITVFTVSNDLVTNRHPSSGNWWSLYNDNWQKDCQGNVTTTTPFFTDANLESYFVPNAPTERGIVIVETYICYDLIMNLPFISDFIPSPFRIHTYTVMPAPEALPTPTPIITSP